MVSRKLQVRKAVPFMLVLLALPAQAASQTVLPFNGSNGQTPSSSPTCLPADPSIPGIYGQEWCFGTTYLGGSVNAGTIYRIKPDGTGQSVLHSFNVFTGLTPSQQPAVSRDRQHLYGTTSQGGVNGSGLIYDFNLHSNSISTLASFSGPKGTTPQAPPIIVGNTLYGITGQSGGSGFGTIWSLPTSGGNIVALHSFAGGPGDVATPFGALTYSPVDRLLYGMAFAGGANAMGGIFSIALDGSSYRLRASFNSSTGSAPQMGALLRASDGLFYGNAWSGGRNNYGTIFRFNAWTNQLTAIFNYTAETGTHPYNQLAESQSGNWLYSVPWLGGANGLGTIIAVKKDGSAARVLLNFDSTTGSQTQAGAAVDASKSRLIIGASGGALNNIGSIVSLTIPPSVR